MNICFRSYDLSDIESFDPEFHQSLSWILENDITDVLDMYFTTDEIVFDQVVVSVLSRFLDSINAILYLKTGI